MKFVYPLVADAGGGLDDFRVDEVVSPVEKFFCELMNERVFEKLKPEFKRAGYDYDGIFFGGHGWPRWAGYSVGYYIVKEYLRRSGKSVFDAVAEPYDLYI